MIKRVLILMMVCVLLLPAQAMANDAFHYDYNGKDLQITIKRLQSDFSIGEDYSFNVSITNTSKWEINLISLESSLFEGGGVYISNIAPDTVRRLNPGEKFTLTCTIEVPYNISWYKKNNEFYYDLTISVGYLIIYSDDEDDYVYAMSVDQPITIMINNLNDGSDFLAMEYTSEDSSGIFEKRWDNANYEEYGYYYDNTITATNTSDFNLEKLLIHGLCVEPLYIYKAPILVDEVNCSVLAPDDKKDETILGRYSVILENLPDSITDRHQAIFMVDENYYAVGLEKEIDMQIAVYPYLDCTINEIDGKSQVTFENNTGFDFENFYFGEPFDLSSEIAVIDESSLMPVFANGKKAEFTVKKYQGYDYFIGYTLGGYFFKWDAQLYISDTGKSYFHIGEHNQYDYIFLSDVTPSPSPSPTPKLTPSPTPTNTPIPTATSTPKPTPSPTAQATPVPTDSPTVFPAIEITDVKKSSSIPFWVLYVLAVAVIAGAVLTVTLRRKNKDKFE